MVACALHGANSSARLEDSGDLRVHLYVEIALLCPLLVSGINSFIDPFIKWLTHKGADNVSNVLTGQLVDLCLHQGQGGDYLIVWAGELQEVLDC